MVDYLNPLLANLVPHQFRRGSYVPEPGKMITIMLPGEILNAQVKRVCGEGNMVIAELTATPMMRSHNYRKGQIISARRKIGTALEVEQWEIIEETELLIQEAAVRLVEEQEATRIAAERAAAAAEQALVSGKTHDVSESPQEPSTLPSGENWSA